MTGPAEHVAHRRLTRLLRGIGALIVLAAILGGVPLLMAAVHLMPHSVPSLHQLKHDLTSRDNGQLALVVIAVGVWICWALFVLSLIPEIVAAARKRPSYTLPGLGGFQRPAGALVAAIAIGFTIAPLITGLGSRASAGPAPLPGTGQHTATSATAPHVTSAGQQRFAAQPASVQRATTRHPTSSTPSTTTHHPTYEVQRRDTLWQIAEDHLGDPMRYTEIVALNQHTLGPDNLIVTGMHLIMPSDATGLSPAGQTHRHPRGDADTVRVRVRTGDTLSGLEEQVTGSANWQPGWDANQGRAEPGGEHFDDPNLIKPGWVLDIPTAATTATPQTHKPPPRHAPSHPRHQPAQTRPPQQNQPEQPGHGSATPTHSAPIASTAPSATQHRPAQADAGHAPSAASEDRYAALTVGGGLLAATTFATLMLLRRRKFRHRRPGHVVASLPPDLVPLEHALLAAGRPSLATMTFLDLALRDLANRIAAQPHGQLPDIAGAAINDDYLELYLAGDNPPAPPQPWLQSDPLQWTLGRDTNLDPGAADRLAPYPCLVSVGYSEDGTEYLLDLEHAGALQLAGDPGRCLDLARYMVAELANNLWSDHLTVTVAGFGAELVDANPTRLAHTDDPHAAAAAVARVAAENRRVAGEAGIDVLAGRLRGTDGDVWMPHVLLAAPGVDPADVDLLRGTATGGRAATAVVLTGGRGGDDGAAVDSAVWQRPRVHVTDTGTLVTSLLPIGDVLALGLPEADAPDLARAIALDRDGALDEPTPRSTGHQPWDAFADAAGALLPEYTEPRTASSPAAIDPDQPLTSSVLPGPDEAYVAAAATTEQDLAGLAPAVTVQTRAAVENADPDLDDLVAAWRDPEARLAGLRLLGPVTVTAYGRPPVKQEDFCTEIVAYLWHKPHGVSTDEFANDLWPNKNYSGTDSYPKDMASRTRQWLGVDPRTGREYWPRARRDGVHGYHLDGLLCDVDLFRRLRARGQARGAEGLPDLVAALDLVSGTPLSRLRPFGYGWLPAGDELLYQGAVAEVAHLVATRALETGDDAGALRACELALEFNGEDDWALLQMTKAHERAGRDAEKEATILRLRTLEDPPARTLEVMRRNGWLSRGA